MPNETTDTPSTATPGNTPDYTSIVDDAWSARERNQEANEARQEAHKARQAKYDAERAAINAAQEKLNTLSENLRKDDSEASKAIDEAFVDQVGADVAVQFGVYTSGSRRR